MAAAKKKAPAKTASPTPKPAPLKSGLRSTEFWLCSLCGLFSILWGAGVIDLAPDAEGNANRVAGLVAGALSAMGYGISLGLAKMNAQK